MDADHSGLLENDKWDLVPHPTSSSIIYFLKQGSFSVKLGFDGSVEQYQSCLVAQGYKQMNGIFLRNRYFFPFLFYSFSMDSNWPSDEILGKLHQIKTGMDHTSGRKCDDNFVCKTFIM